MARRLPLRAGRPEMLRLSDGRPHGVRTVETSPALGPAYLQFAALGSNGRLPVLVTLPAGAVQAEYMSLDGRHVLLPAGAGEILPADVSAESDPQQVQGLLRALGPGGAEGPWCRRNLIFRAPAPVTPPLAEITLSGPPVVTSLSDIEGAPLAISWPVPSRTDPSEQRLIRVYAAAAGGVPTSTIAAGGTVPAVPGSWIAPFYRIFDTSRGEWLEVEAAARLQVEAAVEAGPIVAGDVIWASTWLPGLRQLFTATVNVAGVARADALQARIVTERYVTEWADCPLAAASPSTVRSLPAAVQRPIGQPGEGYPVFELYDDEDRFSIQLRKRASGAPDWTDPSAKLVAPLPAGSIQPNATATTAAELRAAMLAAAASPDLRIIHVTADVVMPSTSSTALHFTNLVKPGRPLIVTSPNRNAPARIRGVTSRLFYFITSRNIILDRLNLWNDRDRAVGGTDNNGTVFPVMQIPAGIAVHTNGSSRIHVRDCLIRHWNESVTWQSSDYIAVEYCEISENGQDGQRMFWRNSNILWHGNHNHSQITNDAYTSAVIQNNYHTDNYQGATSISQARGGHKNGKIVGNRIIGFAGYYSGFLFGNESCQPSSGGSLANLATDAYEDWDFRDNYVEVGQGNGAWWSGVRRLAMRNNVFRTIPGGRGEPSIGFRVLAEDCVVADCVVPVAIQWITRYGGATAAQLQAGVTRERVTVSASAWPATWPATGPGGDRSRAYPTGPDAYRN